MKSDTMNQMMTKKRMVKVAYEEYLNRYKRATSGIQDLKTDIMLSFDPKEVDEKTTRFFGYITKSVNSKKLRSQ